ncbi:MAG: peptidylprolyl isomerase [Proteobacteria bacterium]|nr:peptidylprolyl isomerase [Pseudomonadota bacterium]
MSAVARPPEGGTMAAEPRVARVGDVALNAPDEVLDDAELRQRACTELLRQAAMRAGLLARDDAIPERGATSAAASAAIEALLDRALVVPEPAEDACRRFHAANPARFASGEQVHARHVLFAVTPGVDVAALRRRAEACLVDLRARGADEADRFGAAATTLSNCPSGAHGGDLGWLEAGDCAPEFAREIFGRPEVGVLPRLVHSRHGLHIVEVLERRGRQVPPYESVAPAVAQVLRRQSWATALRQYLQLLAGTARIEGVALEAVAAPLVQ